MTVATAVTADKLSELAALLDTLTFRQKLNLLLRLGVPAEDVMGVDSCTEHVFWRPLGEQEALSFLGDVVWCKGCWKWVKA